MRDRDCLQQLLALDGPHTALTLVEGRVTTLSWSFTELQLQRRYAERKLLALGLRAGDRVLLCTANNPQSFAILLATFSIELCLLPLHPDFSRQQVQDLLQAHAPRLVIVDHPHRIAADSNTSVMLVHEQAEDWLQPLKPGVATASMHSEPSLQAGSDPPLLLFHSSGSTGQPKGLRYTRSMLNRFFGHLSELYAAFPDQGLLQQQSDRVNVLPATHFGGLSFCLQALLEQRSLHLLRSSDASDHLWLLHRQRCQLVLLVPALFQELLRELLAEHAEPFLPELRHCLAMGEAVSQSQLQQISGLLGLPVHNAYGMSECLTGIYNCAAAADAPTGSCGRLHFGEARLLTADGSEHPEEGELCVRNPTTVPCYTDESLNRQKYHDGWYHTGDLFRRDAKGNFFFVSRADLMCVINGRNVYPQDVEQVLLAHPAIALCIAAPVKLANGHQRLAVMAELTAGANLSASALVDFYLQQGAVYATPAWVQFVANIPRNGGDKPDRIACASALQQHYEQHHQHLPSEART